MPTETRYAFDEPLGLYSQESHERLAKMVMAGFVRHEAAQVDADFVERLGDSNALAPILDESRMSSLVESHDAYFGYGLVTPRLDESDELGGVWYQIKRSGEEPTVLDTQNIAFPRPLAMTMHEGAQEVEQLMFQFDKSQLESILRMVSKMTKRLHADRPSRMPEVEKPSQNWLRLTASAPVENDVLYAIKSYSLDDLCMLFPKKDLSPESDPSNPGKDSQPIEDMQHIAEWTDFMAAADSRLQKENNPHSTITHVNLHHEIGDKAYYIKLVADQGQLFGAQILCEDIGGWHSQRFELDSDHDDDEADVNIVSPMWDRGAIIASLQEGEPVDNKTYEGYRSLAEKSLKANFAASSKIVRLEDIRKRPAA